MKPQIYELEVSRTELGDHFFKAANPKSKGMMGKMIKSTFNPQGKKRTGLAFISTESIRPFIPLDIDSIHVTIVRNEKEIDTGTIGYHPNRSFPSIAIQGFKKTYSESSPLKLVGWRALGEDYIDPNYLKVGDKVIFHKKQNQPQECNL